MKKITFLFLSLFISFLSFAQTEYLNGVIVLNEGQSGTPTGEISFISATNQLSNGIFGLANSNAALGDTAQGLSMYEDVAIIVLNISNEVKIVNNKTFQLIATIPGFVNPRYSAAYNGKAYITCWGSSFNTPGYLAVIDLETNTLESTVELSNGAERIKEVNGKLYIAHQFSNIISIYDTETESLEEITVNETPSGLAVLGTDLYVLCGLHSWMPATTPASLYKINTVTNTITNNENLPMGIKAFHMDTDGVNLFIASDNNVYKYDVQNQSFDADPLINTNITGAYGIYGLNVIDESIYLGDAGDYVSPGKAFVYSLQGELQETFTVGITPNSFYKSIQTQLSINKPTKEIVSVYPNPTSDVLNIQSEEEIINVEIYNIQGQKVLNAYHSNSIDVSGFQSGVYILKAKTVNGLSSVKFVKK